MRSVGSFARRSFVARSTHTLARAIVEAVEPRRLLASVTGVVFDDANANGRRDPREGIAIGTVIHADYDYDGTIDVGEPTTRSGPNGAYSLLVDARPFVLRASTPGGLVTSPAAGVQYFVPDATGTGFHSTGTDFGVFAGGASPSVFTISPTVYFDSNGNGVRDPLETAGFAGVTLFADYNYDGVQQAAEPSGTSNQLGSTFITVTARPFALRVSPNPTYAVTNPAAATVFYVPDPAGNGFAVAGGPILIVASGPPIGSIDLKLAVDYDGDGYVDGPSPSLPYELGLGAFIDANRNGTLDVGEQQASLHGSQYGTYSFGFQGLVVGASYRVVLPSLPDGLSFVGSTTRDFVARAGQNSADFVTLAVRGYTRSTIQVSVFEDVNGNGQSDANESQPQGLILFVDLNYNGVLDANEPSGSTNTFANSLDARLSPGGYSVRVISSDGRTVKLPYGATSLWIDASDLGLYRFFLPITFA